MTDDEIREELHRAVPVGLFGLRGVKGGFATLMTAVPRVGEYVNWDPGRGRRGRGRYVVVRIEWHWDHLHVGRAAVHLEPVDAGAP